jgi:hypothetical protein
MCAQFDVNHVRFVLHRKWTSFPVIAVLCATGVACEAAGVAGLLFHDLRRTAARNLRRAGVPETVIMKIGGWRTRSVFERYAIVSRNDIADAMVQLQQSEKTNDPQNGHIMVTVTFPRKTKPACAMSINPTASVI